MCDRGSGWFESGTRTPHRHILARVVCESRLEPLRPDGTWDGD